jgi:N-acetylmuramoyl-L-alanine amidase
MQVITIPRKAPLYLLILLIVLNVIFYAIDVPGNRKEPVQNVQRVYAQETENDIITAKALVEPEIEETIPFTDEEIDLLALITMAEAEGESELGKRLVIDTILNRIDSEARYFPDTVHDVIYQKNQFSPVSDGRLNKVELSTEVHTALARIEEGEVAPEIIGFEVKDSNELEKYFRAVFGYRDHVFYIKK